MFISRLRTTASHYIKTQFIWKAVRAMSTEITGEMAEMQIEKKEQAVNQKGNQKGNKKKEKKKGGGGGGGGGVGTGEMSPWPSYIQERITLFDKLHSEYEEYLSTRERKPIKVTLPDGKEVEGESWTTTPFDIANGISAGLAQNSVISKVNGVLWDLDRPLEGDCNIELLNFSSKEGKEVFWHSTAHILGEAMERRYGGCLCYGPPIESGFYYDMHMGEDAVCEADYAGLETIMKGIVKEKQPFQRLEITKEDLLEMFKYNEYKVRIIKNKVQTPTTTVYRCGPLIDLCRGPHVRNTGKIKTLKVTKNSSTYWEGNAEAESLQRIYGISFPDNKLMKEWKIFQEEAAKRDHRKIGLQQELFFFHELSAGSCFWLPKGTIIFNTLQKWIQSEYLKRGFTEVVTPNMYNTKLWELSGHWQHYAENMFTFDVEKEKFALKPQNCPGHCIMFDHRPRSWRELPVRLADFGVLHRNELSGALSGLTRVRRFQQDDAHIFCTTDQIVDEIRGCLEFMQAIYSVLGFTYELELSTRPDKYLGEIEVWEDAESRLKQALDEFGAPWKLNPADGAFYGPKIDIIVSDALRRAHQCATIQLDFQLPLRFELTYNAPDGTEKRPVIVHRAILGSIERMTGILTEHFAGKWPFWLSPRQVMVVPVMPMFNDYAIELQKKLKLQGIEIDTDLDDGSTLNKKVRNAQLAQYNFIFVIGEKEKTSGTVNVRTRDNVVHGEFSVEDITEKLIRLRDSKSNEDKLE